MADGVEMSANDTYSLNAEVAHTAVVSTGYAKSLVKLNVMSKNNSLLGPVCQQMLETTPLLLL